MKNDSQEQQRLEMHRKRLANWKHWGPYLSDRAWGTVREDYSDDGEAWKYFPHDHARSRAYRWNEDGLGGISDRNQYLCFAPAFWNGHDPILKERFFGLANHEGNHGEDLKEYYFYLDSTPTHSYMKMLYKYPQAEFPYNKLIEENRRRGVNDPEYELLETGVFDQNRYFDIFIEYAKADQDDILIQITAHNRGDQPADLYILPTLWFRNTWSWGYPAGPMNDVPRIPSISSQTGMPKNISALLADHPVLGTYHLYAEDAQQLLFTNNNTNSERLFHSPNETPFVKDAFHRYLINHEDSAVNAQMQGTKAAAAYSKTLMPGEAWTIRLRLTKETIQDPFASFEKTFDLRKQEADDFYSKLQNSNASEEENSIQRKAFAGLLWSKQLYYYDVEQWRKGDPIGPTKRAKPQERNVGWDHLVNFDVISMPDTWEFPWYASWDMAFHCVSMVLVDPDFTKRQLTLMSREWYMHPNGQLPAYEWNLGDTNPPVLAWAAWRVYKIDAHINGVLDIEFLSSIFQKMLINFTWWVNRKDAAGRNVFQGGFLGLDNISIFNRSEPLPGGGHIYQSDATAWMAFYCIIMIKIAMELARARPEYEEMATKFFEHFLRIGAAMINCGGTHESLWDNTDGFFYDVVSMPDGKIVHLKVRSLVGLLPLLAVETGSKDFLDEHPLFKARMQWFVKRYPEIAANMAPLELDDGGEKRLLSILTKKRLLSVLRYLLDEKEFLSEYGIRSLSKIHSENPYHFEIEGKTYTVCYEPGEAQSRQLGGNSNWRGPIWFPLNFLIIESLQKFHYYYGDDLKVECPTGSGNMMTLWEVATELSQRLIKIFKQDRNGKRPVFGEQAFFSDDKYWQDMVLFHEYFHGETGAGLGASHQTGWTALVAKLIQQSGRIKARSTWREDSKNYKFKE